ncbi:MAG: hypothetical protein R3C15_11995 [Thermoleophilia bacterium]
MDGYAVRSVDTAAPPATLTVGARVVTGTPASRALAPGEALPISTGGVVPRADAVVQLERVVESDGRIRIDAPVPAGTNVRDRGGDVRAGGPVLAAGVLLGAAQVARWPRPA